MSIRCFVHRPSEPGQMYLCKFLDPTEATMGLPSPVCGACGRAVVGLWIGCTCSECNAVVVGVSVTDAEEAAAVERWLHQGFKIILKAELLREMVPSGEMQRKRDFGDVLGGRAGHPDAARVNDELKKAENAERGQQAASKVTGQLVDLFGRLNEKRRS